MNSIDKFFEKRREMSYYYKVPNKEKNESESDKVILKNPFLPKTIAGDIGPFQTMNGNYHFVEIESADLNKNLQEFIQKDLINKMYVGHSLKSHLLSCFQEADNLKSRFDIKGENKETLIKQRKIIEDICDNNENISKLEILIKNI